MSHDITECGDRGAVRTVADEVEIAADVASRRNDLGGDDHSVSLNQRRFHERITDRAQIHELEFRVPQPSGDGIRMLGGFSDLVTQLMNQRSLRPLDPLGLSVLVLEPIDLPGLSSVRAAQALDRLRVLLGCML